MLYQLSYSRLELIVHLFVHDKQAHLTPTPQERANAQLLFHVFMGRVSSLDPMNDPCGD